MTDFMKWSDDLSLGLSLIDTDHKRLFLILFNFYEAIMQGEEEEKKLELLHELLDYAGLHFKREEAYMRRIKYSEMKSHILMHDLFRKKIENWIVMAESQQILLSTEITKYVARWLRDHIMNQDQKLKI